MDEEPRVGLEVPLDRALNKGPASPQTSGLTFASKAYYLLQSTRWTCESNAH
jgi:hypothetical protein